jgi:hypothetical protein
MKWSVRNAFIIGLAVGVVGAFASWSYMPHPLAGEWMVKMNYVVGALTPGVLFALIAWIRNRFVRGVDLKVEGGRIKLRPDRPSRK